MHPTTSFYYNDSPGIELTCPGASRNYVPVGAAVEAICYHCICACFTHPWLVTDDYGTGLSHCPGGVAMTTSEMASDLSYPEGALQRGMPAGYCDAFVAWEWKLALLGGITVSIVGVLNLAFKFVFIGSIGIEKSRTEVCFVHLHVRLLLTHHTRRFTKFFCVRARRSGRSRRKSPSCSS